MQPTQLVPGQPIAAAPVNTSNLGVATPTAQPAPTPTLIPAAQAPAPAPTPASVGTQQPPGILNNIAALYKIPGQTAQIVNQGQSAGNVAGTQFAAQKGQNEINIQNMQNQLNPDEYTIAKDPKSGGITIINSLGDQVSLATYANLTGSNPAEVLQEHGATDASDVKFMTAYNNLQSYAQAQVAAQNGDAQAQATVKQFQDANPGLKGLELGQLSAAFMAQYGSYFGAPTNAAGGDSLGGLSGVNNTLSQVNNPQALSAYENPTYANLPGGSGATVGTYTPAPTASATGVNTSGNLSSLLQQQLGTGS